MEMRFCYQGEWLAEKAILDKIAKNNTLLNTDVFIFGELVMEALGIDGGFIDFAKCKEKGYYKIFYVLDKGDERMVTVTEKEILSKLPNVTIHGSLTMEVKRV